MKLLSLSLSHFRSRGAVFEHEFAICSGHSSDVRVRPFAPFRFI